MHDTIEEMSAECRNRCLLTASRAGHTEVVSKLLELKTDVDTQSTDDGMTALMGAAQGGHAEVVKVLLDKGAETCICNYKHLSAYQLAVGDDVKALICAPSAGMTPLILEAEFGREDVVADLIRIGAKVNETWQGTTALKVAVREGHAEVVKTLLDGGANVYANSDAGTSALNEAIELQDPEILQHLIDHGAMINMKDAERTKALLWAAKHGNDATFRMLLANDALRSNAQWTDIYKFYKVDEDNWESELYNHWDTDGRETVLDKLVNDYEKVKVLDYREIQVRASATPHFAAYARKGEGEHTRSAQADPENTGESDCCTAAGKSMRCTIS